MDTTEMPATSTDATSMESKKKVLTANPAFEALKNMQKAVHIALFDCESGDELETLVRTLRYNSQVEQVKEDILAAFQQYFGWFKEDQLHLFGSTVMGIAFKDSDLDFYVELPNWRQPESEKGRIKIIRNILERTDKFTSFESITRARVPILKCTHIGTLTNCDFNCSNRFGILNGRIIGHLLNFDPRIYKLAIVIKYWMKIHGCAGINRISNYAVVWMLIFYLQTLPKPIVPPIDEFQRNVPPLMVSHYNFAFDYAMPNKTENQSEWSELLLGFFTFYRDFDYDSQLICPLFGKTFSKADVKKRKVIELKRYEQILSADSNEQPMRLDAKSLYIQDPFEIVRELPGDISIRKFQNIVWKIGYAAEIIESELQKGETESLFLQIFDVDKFDKYVRQKEIQQGLEKRVQAHQLDMERHRLMAEYKKAHPETLVSVDENKNQKTTKKAKRKNHLSSRRVQDISITSVYYEDAQNGEITLVLQPTYFLLYISQYEIRKILPNNDNVPTDHFIRKMWAKEVIEMIVDILQDIFHLDLYDKSSAAFAKKFDLIGARNIFSGRKRTTVHAKAWNEEVTASSNIFNRTSKNHPLYVSAEIAANTVNFGWVSVEFNDQIKTKDDNFYTTFCQEFIDRIDYFLKIYFAHRYEKAVKSGAETNASNMETATDPAAQQKSTSTLSTTPVTPIMPFTLITPFVSQDLQNPKTTIRIRRTAFMLSTLRDMWSENEDAKSQKLSVGQFWAQGVIKMITDILGDIFNLELHNETSDGFLTVFDLSGARDLFSRRKQKKSVSADTWFNEMFDSAKRFRNLTCIVPLKISAKITTDLVNFDYVSVEFNDQIKTSENNFFRTFCAQFIDGIDYFLKILFLHRIEMVKSKLANASQSKEKPTAQNSRNPTITFQFKPTKSALSMAARIVSNNQRCSNSDTAKSEKPSIQQLWAQEVMKMIAGILTDIFKLEVHNETYNTYLRMCTFDLTGLCDSSNRMFLRRKQKKSFSAATWTKEKADSSVRFHSTSFPCDVPLKLSVRITDDTKNFDCVSIEFNDEIKTRKKNFYLTFCQDFTSRIDYFLKIYLAHRHKEAAKSAAVTAAKNKLAKSVVQQ